MSGGGGGAAANVPVAAGGAGASAADDTYSGIFKTDEEIASIRFMATKSRMAGSNARGAPTAFKIEVPSRFISHIRKNYFVNEQLNNLPSACAATNTPCIFTWLFKAISRTPYVIAAVPITQQELGTLHKNIDEITRAGDPIIGGEGVFNRADGTFRLNALSGTYTAEIVKVRGVDWQDRMMETVIAHLAAKGVTAVYDSTKKIFNTTVLTNHSSLGRNRSENIGVKHVDPTDEGLARLHIQKRLVTGEITPEEAAVEAAALNAAKPTGGTKRSRATAGGAGAAATGKPAAKHRGGARRTRRRRNYRQRRTTKK
jgi:hypothetical protein